MPDKAQKGQDAKATKELIESLLEKLKPYFDTFMQHGKEERENINKVFNRLLLFFRSDNNCYVYFSVERCN